MWSRHVWAKKWSGLAIGLSAQQSCFLLRWWIALSVNVFWDKPKFPRLLNQAQVNQGSKKTQKCNDATDNTKEWKISHTCPIFWNNEIHSTSQETFFICHTIVAILLKIRIMGTLHDAHTTSRESHYSGVLDNPQISRWRKGANSPIKAQVTLLSFCRILWWICELNLRIWLDKNCIYQQQVRFQQS